MLLRKTTIEKKSTKEKNPDQSLVASLFTIGYALCLLIKRIYEKGEEKKVIFVLEKTVREM